MYSNAVILVGRVENTQ